MDIRLPMAAALLAGLTIWPVTATAATASVVYASPTGNSHAADTSCATARYSVIEQAIAATATGGRVVVCKGTYTLANQHVTAGQPLVHVGRPMTLAGESATLKAGGATAGSGAIVGILVTASDVTVTGFTVTGAVDEGILVEPPAAWAAGPTERPATPVSPVTRVTVSHDVTRGDDRGYQSDFCAHQYPSTCGGGIHFNAVAFSTLSYDTVTGNVDGVLLSDDAGPTDHDTVIHDMVANNTVQCGITLPSHNVHAATFAQNANGSYRLVSLNPAEGGVFDNVVEDSVATGNGTVGYQGYGSGAGVLLAGDAVGTAVYGNLVEGDQLTGNGLSGVTMHGHYPGGEYLSGNVIKDDTIGLNDSLGDGLDSPVTTVDGHTTGIMLFAAQPTTVTVTGNQVSDDVYGVWRNPAVGLKVGDNSWSSVTTAIYTEHRPFGSGYCGTPVGPRCATSKASATVTALTVPNGSWSVYYVEYGRSSSRLASYTRPTSDGSGVTLADVHVTISGLAAATKYYYRVLVQNSAGIAAGYLGSFNTAAG
jgi:hypothetical protein